jgi:hypothetical protein
MSDETVNVQIVDEVITVVIEGDDITNVSIEESATINVQIDNFGNLVTSVNGKLGAVVLDADDLEEGDTNKFYTEENFDTSLATKSTDDIAEGINLYYTEDRFNTALATKTTTDLAEGDNLYYTQDRFNTAFNAKSTDDLDEGSTNQYFTNDRADTRADARIAAARGAANGITPLGADSKIPDSYLPALAISDTFVVASEVAMLALDVQPGDIAKRTDTNDVYILKDANASLLASWVLISSNFLSDVTSVNGFTGAVTLSTTDVAEGVNLYLTTERVQDIVGAFLADSASIDFDYNDLGNSMSVAVIPGGVDHNSLANLATGDVHTQYALLAGRSGGQTISGGSGAGESLILSSTSHSTKGNIQLGATSRMLLTSLNQIGVGMTQRMSTFSIQAQAARTLTGTLAIDGTGNVVGTGTLFLTETGLGDALTIGGQKKYIKTITDNTHLVVADNYDATASGQTGTLTPAIFVAVKTDGTVAWYVDERGRAIFGAPNDTDPSGTIDTQAVFTRTSTGAAAYLQDQSGTAVSLVFGVSVSLGSSPFTLVATRNNSVAAGYTKMAFQPTGSSVGDLMTISGYQRGVGIGAATVNLSTLTTQSLANVTGTGTVSTTAGSAVVTGVGTFFTLQFSEGDRITVNGETYIVRTITSNTSITTDTNYVGNNSGVAFTVIKSVAVFKITGSTNPAVFIDSRGHLNIYDHNAIFDTGTGILAAVSTSNSGSNRDLVEIHSSGSGAGTAVSYAFAIGGSLGANSRITLTRDNNITSGVGILTLNVGNGSSVDEIVRLMGSTRAVGINKTTNLNTLSVTPRSDITATGTVSNSAGGSTVTGVGTFFTLQCAIGDRVTINGETVFITAIASNTSMTTETITGANSGVAMTIKKSIAGFYDNSGAVKMVISDTGQVYIGRANGDSTLDVNGSVRIRDNDIKLGTTTGTKIGTGTTQKIGFWNATPIVQPTTSVAAATFVANTSNITNDTGTFDGYTIGQIVKALRNIGLLA